MRFKMTNLKLSAICSLALLVSGNVMAQGPDRSEVYINSVAYGGDGCRQGTVGSYLSDDAKAFTLSFDEFMVQQYPGSEPSEARRFCNISLDIHVPGGWQFSIFQVDYRGYADLERGVLGTQQSTYRFSGMAGRNSSATLSTRIRGPFSDDYEINDTLGLESSVWSPCGVNRALNIKSEVRLTGNRRASGLLTVDTIDGEFKTIYKLNWRRCRR